MEVQRTSGCSEPAAAATQRRQRPSDGNDPAAATNQRTSDGGGVGCREREERNGDCGGEGERKKGWLGCREREERNELFREMETAAGKKKKKKGHAFWHRLSITRGQIAVIGLVFLSPEAKACAVSGSFVNLGDRDGLYASVSLGPEAEC
ncbi:hypothetical protein DEO72_LG8g2919 [Vigna unguiculata]|uniref:Uncharacterized protein n=1 Tax=Vigna unguiculata TaxID=3917 RepID=A0A4D6MUR7_VIGUN|nr:hypothetical protein DEO72_LG8g2919 [Vigna unguiculata]